MNRSKGTYLQGVKYGEQVVQDCINLDINPISTLRGCLNNLDNSYGINYINGFCDYIYHFCDNKYLIVSCFKEVHSEI